MSALVTGEAVVLDLQLARLPTRMFAILIDIAALVAASIGLLLVIGALATTADPALVDAVSIGALVLIVVVIPTTVETLSRGRSLGKLALGLRVVRDDGGPVRLRHSLGRALSGATVDFLWTGGAGAVISSILSSKGKRLGDQIAGTVVIKERTAAAATALPPMPPQLEAWSRALELSRLPDDLALAVRGYVTRWPSMAPQYRDDLGLRLAAAVSAVVTPAPPPGTPPWAYLLAVLVERRRRSEAVLHAYLTDQPQWPTGLLGPPPRPTSQLPAAQVKSWSPT